MPCLSEYLELAFVVRRILLVSVERYNGFYFRFNDSMRELI